MPSTQPSLFTCMQIQSSTLPLLALTHTVLPHLRRLTSLRLEASRLHDAHALDWVELFGCIATLQHLHALCLHGFEPLSEQPNYQAAVTAALSTLSRLRALVGLP